MLSQRLQFFTPRIIIKSLNIIQKSSINEPTHSFMKIHLKQKLNTKLTSLIQEKKRD